MTPGNSQSRPSRFRRPQRPQPGSQPIGIRDMPVRRSRRIEHGGKNYSEWLAFTPSNKPVRTCEHPPAVFIPPLGFLYAPLTEMFHSALH